MTSSSGTHTAKDLVSASPPLERLNADACEIRRVQSGYTQLKTAVEADFTAQSAELFAGKREIMDPYTYDLRYATSFQSAR
jgi:hypothetical protein